jgi:ribonucleoside-diphosphate reductase alpha chain
VILRDGAGEAPAAVSLVGGGRLEEVSAASIVLETTKATFLFQQDAPSCHDCGSIMVRNGSCYKCNNCGSTSGCS